MKKRSCYPKEQLQKHTAIVPFTDNIRNILGIKATTMDDSLFKCLTVNSIVGNFNFLNDF